MSLLPYVQILGRGPGRSRSLTEDEAREAMRLVLAGEGIAPEALGALLMLMRFRGETAGEVAGFAGALRDHVAGEMARSGPAELPRVDLDWPSYAAGRTRGLPYFLLAARLVAQAGHRVVLHGWNSHQNPVADVRAHLNAAGIALVDDLAALDGVLARDHIAYVPLETISARALELLKLRDILGLRSAVNTVLRVMNPFCAPASVQGVFHPPYRDLQMDAGALLGQKNLSVIKGGGGEFERHPGKDTAIFGLRDGQAYQPIVPGFNDATRRLADAGAQSADLAKLWRGEISDDFARDIVIGTAALALDTTAGHADASGQSDAAMAHAQSLWETRS